MPVNLPLYRKLQDGSAVELDLMRPEETETVRLMFNNILEEGVTYPQTSPLSPEGFRNYWLKGSAFVVRRPATLADDTKAAQVVGAFYIKPNFPGRCSHICNAGFIVPPEARGMGIGRFMGEALLDLARDRGYRAVMYNLVFETNLPSLRLWQSLGFEEIGRIPAGVKIADDQYADALMLYKRLV